MSLDYFVVFEHTQKTGGYAGNRFFTAYSDEADFQKHNDPVNDNFKVIARGITEEEAQNLTALTPEICRLTAAVEEICSDDDEINAEVIQYQLPQVCFAIEDNRRHRRENGLSPETPFTFVDIGILKDSPKKRLLSQIKEMFYSRDGTIKIDFNTVMASITLCALRIQSEDLGNVIIKQSFELLTKFKES